MGVVTMSMSVNQCLLCVLVVSIMTCVWGELVCDGGECEDGDAPVILFHDAKANPYDRHKIKNEASGCSQASVVRVVERLKEVYPEALIAVLQPRRKDVAVDRGVYYINDSEKQWARIEKQSREYAELISKLRNPTHVVLLRLALILDKERERFPSARLLFWHHDQFIVKDEARLELYSIADAFVPVSASHGWSLHEKVQERAKYERKKLEEGEELDWSEHWVARDFASIVAEERVHPIYNPLSPDDIDVKKWADEVEEGAVNDDAVNGDGSGEYVLFMSSMLKGTERALTTFELLREQYPGLKLHLANPGYYGDKEDAFGGDNVVNLGALPHREVIKELQSAFAVLLTTGLAETFGCVFAEANALGVPVVAGDIGAAAEVLHPASAQTVPQASSRDPLLMPQRYAERVLEWLRGGRPVVGANRAFQINCVVAEWANVLRLPAMLPRCSHNAMEELQRMLEQGTVSIYR